MMEMYDEEDNKIPVKTKSSSRLQARFAAGYSAERLYYGISAVNDSFNINDKKTNITQQFGNVKVFLGFRFNMDKDNKSQ